MRDNLDWLARATNWDKLSATASLGVIHRGHEKDSLAFSRIARGIGATTFNKIENEAVERNLSLWETIIDIVKEIKCYQLNRY